MPTPTASELARLLVDLWHPWLRRYIDGELLNALLLRRDCCSVSAAKVGAPPACLPACLVPPPQPCQLAVTPVCQLCFMARLVCLNVSNHQSACS